MRLEEIYRYIDGISPFELQEKWDNSGLIVGSMSREISEVVVALDLDLEMIAASKEGTLFVVHHPLIFGGLERLDFASYPANLIERLIQKQQSLIAAHTNFDKTHLNRFVLEEVLGMRMTEQSDFVCVATGEWHYEKMLKLLRQRLDLRHELRVVNPKETIRSIALTTGSGASLMDTVEADCFLTGDIKYHDAVKATNQGLMMVDIGHYESERFFADLMTRELKFLGISAIITGSKNPFVMEQAH